MHGVFPAGLDLSHVGLVLDLACGPGEWANQVAFESLNMQVVGVDINQTMIEYASAFARIQVLPNISFECMDLKNPLDFGDGSFDLINGRFLVGFLDQRSWPALLAECWRVLSPGGILILSECELGVSSSPALQSLGGWFTRALCQQKRTFSADGHTMGIVQRLSPLLHQAGFVAVQHQPFVLDASPGCPLYASCFREFEVTYALLRPYLLRSGVVDPSTYDQCYQRMLIEIQQEDFTDLSFGIRTWGRKPILPGMNDG